MVIRTPPQHNTENPPGQIKYPVKKGLYLRDIIKRIEGEEGHQIHNPLPTPIAGPEKRLNELVGALLAYCRGQREHATPKERMMLEDIRKIISESR